MRCTRIKKKEASQGWYELFGRVGEGTAYLGEEGNGMIDGPSRHERVTVVLTVSDEKEETGRVNSRDKRGVRMAAGKAKGQPPAKR